MRPQKELAPLLLRLFCYLRGTCDDQSKLTHGDSDCHSGLLGFTCLRGPEPCRPAEAEEVTPAIHSTPTPSVAAGGVFVWARACRRPGFLDGLSARRVANGRTGVEAATICRIQRIDGSKLPGYAVMCRYPGLSGLSAAPNPTNTAGSSLACRPNRGSFLQKTQAEYPEICICTGD